MLPYSSSIASYCHFVVCDASWIMGERLYRSFWCFKGHRVTQSSNLFELSGTYYNLIKGHCRATCSAITG
jgi:hypothetical protein